MFFGKYYIYSGQFILEHKPATCWITVVVVVSTNTLLVVGAIQVNIILTVSNYESFFIQIVKKIKHKKVNRTMICKSIKLM